MASERVTPQAPWSAVEQEPARLVDAKLPKAKQTKPKLRVSKKAKRPKPPKTHYPVIFLSDIHLGYKECKATFLLDFLRRTSCDTLYLVGDVVDMWAMSKNFVWPKAHHAVLKKLLKIASKGTRVIYIPGNHDSLARDLVEKELLGVEVHRNYVHQSSDGRRFFMCHGDEFENAIRHSKLNRILGDLGYDILLWINRWGNACRSLVGLPYWSLATFIKNRVEKARETIRVYEEAAAAYAKSHGYDGIICGHIHQPQIRKIDGVLYCNDGDWTESCTAMVETESGRLELIHWTDEQQTLKVEQQLAADLDDLPIERIPRREVPL